MVLPSGYFPGLRIKESNCGSYAFIAQYVTDDFVECIGLHWLLNKMASALLQSSQNVVLIAHRRDHNDAGLRVISDNALHGLDALHLRHGDVHQHDIWRGTGVFGDGGQAVARLASHRAAKSLDHFGQAFAREDGVVHDQIADRLLVLLACEGFGFLHDDLLRFPGSTSTPSPT